MARKARLMNCARKICVQKNNAQRKLRREPSGEMRISLRSDVVAVVAVAAAGKHLRQVDLLVTAVTGEAAETDTPILFWAFQITSHGRVVLSPSRKQVEESGAHPLAVWT